MCIVSVISGIFGPQWWSQTVSEAFPQLDPLLYPESGYIKYFLDLPLNNAIALVAIVVTIPLLTWNIYQVLHTVIIKNQSVITAFSILIPIFGHVLLNTLWFIISPARIFETHTIIVLTFYGTTVSFLIDILILKRITKQKFSPLQFVILFPAIGLANAYFNPNAKEIEVLLLKVLLGLMILIYTHMVLNVISSLCDYLKIKVFVIKKKAQ